MNGYQVRLVNGEFQILHNGILCDASIVRTYHKDLKISSIYGEQNLPGKLNADILHNGVITKGIPVTG